MECLRWAVAAFGAPKVRGDLRELIEGGFQVFDDFGGDDGGVGQVGGISKAVVFQPEDVEVDLVALDQVVVSEGSGTAPSRLRW